MNTQAALTPAQRIDEISSKAVEIFASAESFEKELAVARSITDMRAALTPEIMTDVMALMNTSLGFRTDRDPKVTPLDKAGQPMTPYPVEVVKDAFIEARLRGFHVINNEFNIIAGRFYGCLNGFDRLVRQSKKVTDYRDTFSVPVMRDGGAIVKARADWRQEGTAQSLEREFAIRVNTGMGADAILGKAKRKLLAAVYSRLSGVVTPEGEADGEVVELKASTTTTAPATASALFPGGTKAAEAKPGDDQVPGAEVPAKSATTEKKAEPAKAPEQETSQAVLERTMTSSGVSFDDFRDFIAVKGLVKAAEKDSLSGYRDLPDKLAARIVASSILQAECIKKFGNVQKK